MGVTKALTDLGSAMFGSKFAQAFAADAFDGANLGRAAVMRSHADSAKSIIDKAVKANAFSGFSRNGQDIGADAAKSIAESIQKAYNKGSFTDTFDLAGDKLNINDAMQTLIYDSVKKSDKAGSAAMKDAIEKFTSTEAGKVGAGALYGAFASSGRTAEDAAAFFGRGASEGLGLHALSGFFQDADYGKTRTQAAIGGAVAGAIGLRHLSGGDMTHNARGERDIAGIPFI